jgi:class 3 adenylate cyclase
MVEGTQRRLAAIVSADVVDYSRLMGVDETRTLAALRAHRIELIDPLISEHGGRIVKTMGDGLPLEYPSVVDATQCVIEIQKGMVERNVNIDEGLRLVACARVNQLKGFIFAAPAPIPVVAFGVRRASRRRAPS